MERTIQPEEMSARRNLENYVMSHNKILQKAVKSMSPIILLRNAHPMYRSDFARELKKAGLLSEEATKEFIKTR